MDTASSLKELSGCMYTSVDQRGQTHGEKTDDN